MDRAEELVADFDGMLGASQGQQDAQPYHTRGAPCLAVAGLFGTLRSLCLLLSKLRAPLRSLKLVGSAIPIYNSRHSRLLLHKELSLIEPSSPCATILCDLKSCQGL
jgi:hypothetical protein